MHEPIFFASSCPKCRQRQPQRGFSRAALLRLLSAGHPIEADSASCDEFWALGPREQAALAGEVNGRGAADSAPQAARKRLL